MQDATQSRSKEWIARWWDALAVALLGAWMLFANLGSALFEPDEARYAEIPRLMLRRGDWVTPRLQGKPYNDKPPLVYWLIAGSYSLLGVSLEAARAVPTCFGWLTLLVVYAWTRRHLGRSVAFLSAFVLLTTLGFVALARMLLLDGVLTFFVVTALLTGHHALACGRRWGWLLLSAVLCGGGILTKGPVAVVLILPCLVALRWLDRATTPIRMRDLLGYVVIACGLAVPWYAAMLLTNERFGDEFFLRHHLQRFLAPAHHERPFWYYVPTLFLELMPWSFLVAVSWPRWRSWTGPERLLVFFAAWCFVFFSLAQCKLPTYLLPMLPAVAVLVASSLRSLQVAGHPARCQRLAFVGGLVLLSLTLAVRDLGIHVSLKEGLPRVDTWALAVAGVLLGSMVVGGLRRRAVTDQQPAAGWALGGLAAWCLVMWTCHDAIPEFADSTSVVPACRRLAARADAEGIPCVAHRNSWDAFSFLRNGEELEVYSSKEWPDFHTWLRQHRRCMIWMRDGDDRLTKFVKNLPAGIKVENVFDCGKVHGVVLRHATEERTARN